jgi:hypothetical protein
LAAVRIRVMYLVAILLLLLVPVMFFAFGTGLVERIGRKIPIREGTFDASGGLQIERGDVPR